MEGGRGRVAGLLLLSSPSRKWSSKPRHSKHIIYANDATPPGRVYGGRMEAGDWFARGCGGGGQGGAWRRRPEYLFLSCPSFIHSFTHSSTIHPSTNQNHPSAINYQLSTISHSSFTIRHSSLIPARLPTPITILYILHPIHPNTLLRNATHHSC